MKYTVVPSSTKPPASFLTIAVMVDFPPGTFDSGFALKAISSVINPAIQLTSVLLLTAPIKAVTVAVSSTCILLRFKITFAIPLVVLA